MGEYYETESGVEMIPETGSEVPAAGEQGAETTTEQTTETGDNQDPAAAEQGASTEEQQFDERTETAFARRLSAERERIQREVYQQAQAEMMQQYQPLLELAQYEAQRHGMDPVSWARAVQANREQAYQQQLHQAAEDFGVDPQIFNQLVANHPMVVQAQQLQQQFKQREEQMSAQQKLNQEAAEFAQAFPEIDGKTITPEVWELREKTGLSILDAYMRVNYKNMIADAKLQAEQAAVKALQNNAQSSPGALGGEGAEQKTGYAALSKAERRALRDKVLRGENVQL